MTRSLWRRNDEGYYWVGPHPQRELRRRISMAEGRGSIVTGWEVWIETRDGMHMRQYGEGDYPSKAEARTVAEALTLGDQVS
jgi:poly(3-hydroxyalkanoate) synthetase